MPPATSRDGRKYTKKGAALRWLDEVALRHVGDECLTFPFYRAKSGHGRLSGRNGPCLAHVYVAEKTLGPKPSPDHECCHSCGRGCDGCVSPHHLYWGTRAQNMADRKTHGVAVDPPRMQGTDNFRATLTPDLVRSIRQLRHDGMPSQDIARSLSVGKGAVDGVIYGHTWKWLI